MWAQDWCVLDDCSGSNEKRLSEQQIERLLAFLHHALPFLAEPTYHVPSPSSFAAAPAPPPLPSHAHAASPFASSGLHQTLIEIVSALLHQLFLMPVMHTGHTSTYSFGAVRDCHTTNVHLLRHALFDLSELLFGM
jgi:hypothetical protein